MKNINFKSRIKIMSLTSFIESTFLILAITSLILQLNKAVIYSMIVYLGCRIVANITWRCPKCRTKLPQVDNDIDVDECMNCNCDLCK